jgi:hypothetical protein
MKKNGGKATVENGALLSAENHAWFHQQSPAAQGYMNAIFQEYKKQVDECIVVFTDELELPFEVKSIEFSVNKKGEFNRAKEKRKTQKLIDDYYDQEK